MVLPDGFALPPLLYLLPLLLAVGVVLWLLWEAEPTIGERTVVSLAPWMVVGAGFNALHQLPNSPVPDVIDPLFGTPSVYLTTFVLVGIVWLLAIHQLRTPVPRALAGVGLVGVALVLVVALWFGIEHDSLRLFWPFVALVVAVILTGMLWAATQFFYPDVAIITGAVGVLTLFAHALDGVSTAVGIDVLGFGEQTPLSRAILEIAHSIPAGDSLGVGWLFVLVKLAIAEFVVLLFADYVASEPTEGYLLLGVVAAVGLGPGAHNLILFAITG
ncbi:DUF63 family protein [Haladaptatus sp. AB618]|uniref:DUF63 family protein n=1 Tax=Haladaptatus sp. AB618 TaxID=2934173 RepID=UPI00209C0788|nr:DUF63 family protein [Haladaptatus sp. AB618]MCO8252959.1 DUF63 family protein [Haladaptatus sp. AB618]